MSYFPITKFDASNMSAFGTLETAELTPVLQGDFVYGLNIQTWAYVYVFTVTSPGSPPVFGDVYTNNNAWFTVIYSSGTVLVCSGTAAPAASGNLTRLIGAGTTPIAFSAFTTQAGVTNGTGATIDTNSSRLRIQCGTNSAGYAYVLSRRIIRYRAGQGTLFRFTPIFGSGIADNIQLWGAGSVVDNAPYDGYFFGYNGTSFGIVHYVRGVATWTAQANWNSNTLLSGSFVYDPTLGTAVMIKYPYLGYGDIEFFVQNPTNARWILIHTIRYGNTVATTQLSNPTPQFMGFILNSGNTTNKTMYCGSIGAFISGERSFIGNPKWAADVTKTGITTEAGGLSVRNCNTFNGITNRGLLRLHSVGYGTNTNTYGVIRLKLGVTLGGTPSFAAISGTTGDNGTTVTGGNSIASVDTAGTTISGGIYGFNMPIGATGPILIDLVPYDLFVAPGEILTATIFAANAVSGNLSLNWGEDT